MKIEPCPFCGVDNSYAERVDDYELFARTCRACCARGPTKNTVERADNAWNAAPRLTPAAQAVLDAAVAVGKWLILLFKSKAPATPDWRDRNLGLSDRLQATAVAYARERTEVSEATAERPSKATRPREAG